MLLLFSAVIVNDRLFGKELCIRLTMRVVLERLSIVVCPSFPFGFEGGVLDLIVLIPDHRLSLYFAKVVVVQ